MEERKRKRERVGGRGSLPPLSLSLIANNAAEAKLQLNIILSPISTSDLTCCD
jgi:hypothetical protein